MKSRLVMVFAIGALACSAAPAWAGNEACCLANGDCFDLPPATCEAIDGFPQGPGSTCENTNCMPACCLADGSCEDILQSECIDRGGTVHFRDSCADGFECPAACCFPEDASCFETGITECENIGGNYQGDGTVCDGYECPGACCIGAECVNLPISVCETSQECDGNEDCPGQEELQCRGGFCRTFRCPNGDSDCPGGVEGSCVAEWCNLDGDFQPASCEFTECIEACCLGEGQCVDDRPTNCVEARGGEPAGPGTVCFVLCESHRDCPGNERDTCVDGLCINAPRHCDTVQSCCFDDGRCEDLEQTECLDGGGFPQGDGMTCASDGCPQACCLDGGLCDNLLVADCIAEGGTPRGVGTACADSGLECPRACCLGDGSCEELEPTDCVDRGGESFIRETCDTVECAEACCVAGECSDRPPSECTEIGGTPQGPGSDCETAECLGACCLGSECFEMVRRVCETNQPCDRNEDCPRDGEQRFQCRSGVCRTIRCPNGDSDCPGGVEGSCSAGWCNLDGSFSGQSCDDVECPEACCMPNEDCLDVGSTECVERGGSPAGPATMCFIFCERDRDCPDNERDSCVDGICINNVPCAPAEQCCLPDGSCADERPNDCDAMGGISGGEGTTCRDAGACFQACCREDEDCVDLPVIVCEGLDPPGNPAGFRTTCADDPDPCDPPQACCLAEGACQDLQPADCTARGGASGGEGTTCAGDGCSEACCLADGTCVDLSFSICLAAGGAPRGVGSDCANSTCTEACCLDGGTCVDIAATDCIAVGGAPGGLDTVCDDVTCLEACCFGRDVCLNLEPDTCTGGDGETQGAGTDCKEDPDICTEGGCTRDPEWQCDGDTDGDGQVNPVDSGLVQASFGSTDEADLCQYDVDCDGQINPVDSGIVQSLFGTCNAPRDSCE